MRNVVVAVVAALLVLTLAFYFVLYRPASQQQAELELERDALVDQQQSVRNQITQLEAVADNEVAIRTDLARLQEFIPTGAAQATLVRDLQLAADASGVSITSVGFAEPVVVEGAPAATGGLVLGRIETTMRVAGGYFQAVDFLRRLEVEVSRAILVETLVLQEGPDVGFPILELTWTGDLFALILPPVEAGVPGAAPTPAPGATPAPGETAAPGEGVPATPGTGTS